MMPDHLEIQSISINGQRGLVVFETRHEGLDQVYAFEEEWLGPEQDDFRWVPTNETV